MGCDLNFSSICWNEQFDLRHAEKKKLEFTLTEYDKWVRVNKARRFLRLRIEEWPPIWRVAANILNVQSLTTGTRWSSSLGVGWGATIPHRKNWTCYKSYEGGPKNNRNLNVAHELEVVARCAARCRESTHYSKCLKRGVSLGLVLLLLWLFS
jgi:hypothetical protein